MTSLLVTTQNSLRSITFYLCNTIRLSDSLGTFIILVNMSLRLGKSNSWFLKHAIRPHYAFWHEWINHCFYRVRIKLYR